MIIYNQYGTIRKGAFSAFEEMMSSKTHTSTWSSCIQVVADHMPPKSHVEYSFDVPLRLVLVCFAWSSDPISLCRVQNYWSCQNTKAGTHPHWNHHIPNINAKVGGETLKHKMQHYQLTSTSVGKNQALLKNSFCRALERLSADFGAL